MITERRRLSFSQIADLKEITSYDPSRLIQADRGKFISSKSSRLNCCLGYFLTPAVSSLRLLIPLEGAR